MFPTSLPGAILGGITAPRPTSPPAPTAASVGMAAASSGVRPPSSSTGSSAQPSGTQITYFTGPVSQVRPSGPPRGQVARAGSLRREAGVGHGLGAGGHP